MPRFPHHLWHHSFRKLLSSGEPYPQMCHHFRSSMFHIFTDQQILHSNEGSRHFFQIRLKQVRTKILHR